MAIRKRITSDGKARFVALYRDPSGKQCSAGSFETERAAKLALGEIDKAKFNGTYKRVLSITFEECAKLWMAERSMSGQVRPTTAEGYLDNFRAKLFPELGAFPMSSITTAHLAKLRAGFLGQSDSYSKKCMWMVSSIFEYAIRNGYAAKNPIQYAPKPKRFQKPTVKKALTAKEIQALLEVVENHIGVGKGVSKGGKRYGMKFSKPLLKWRRSTLKVYYKLSIFTGLRPSEIAALNWDDIDFENREVTVSKSLDFFKRKTEGPKKWLIQEVKTKAGYRKVPLTTDLIKDLQILKIEAPETTDNFVLEALGGGPVRQEQIYARHFKNDLKRASIAPMHLYKLRHTFVSLLIAQGGSSLKNLQRIQYLMGHADFQTTMNIYAQLFPENMTSVADDLEAYVFRGVNILSTNHDKLD